MKRQHTNYTLQTAMETLLSNPELRINLGRAGRERVLNKFNGGAITAEWVRFYHDIFQQHQ